MSGETMTADVSPCGLYRTRLDRRIGVPGPHVVMVGVNPSTADAFADDATVRKLIGFADRNGWGRLTLVNKFAYRATDVKELARAVDPIGPGCHEAIVKAMEEADIILGGWGRLAKLPKRLRTRWWDIVKMAAHVGKDIHHLGVSDKDGQPMHPLFRPYSTPLQIWREPHDLDD